MFTRKNLYILYITLGALAAAIVIWLVILFHSPFFADKKESQDFIIDWGESFYSVAERLEELDIINNKKSLYLVSKIMSNTLDIKAGMYTLPLHSSNYHVLKTITGGQQSFIKVTIPEGLTAKRIAALVADTLDLDEQTFLEYVYDTTFIRELNIQFGYEFVSLEGLLFPETYHFSFGLNEKRIAKKLVAQFFNHVSDSLITQGHYYNFDLNKIITLASIIEGEAIFDSEKPVISSVYHNRLKQGMRLQADPTIQYILKDGPRRLLNRDLELDSPYNTYMYAGLPPGPINNPGLAAITAAVFPDTTDYLYFVADGKGGHVFSSTLEQHNRAKRDFNKIRRKVAREKRRGGVN